MLGMRVERDAEIALDKRAKNVQENAVTIALNKPYSFLSQSSTPNERQRFAKDLLEWRNQSVECTYMKGRRRQQQQQRASGRTSKRGARASTSPCPPSRLKKLACAGRLDTESSGLLIFTQNGSLARRIVGVKKTGEDTRRGGQAVSKRDEEVDVVDKEYVVTVARKSSNSSNASSLALNTPIVTDAMLHRFRDFGTMDGKRLLPVHTSRVAPKEWRPEPRLDLWPEGHSKHVEAHRKQFEQMSMTLNEGKYHQIRRMCDAVGLNVVALVRVRVGNLELGKLRSGFWRVVDAVDI